MKYAVILIFLSLPVLSKAQKFNTLEKVSEIPESDLIPEGIAHDPQSDAFYIGSLYKNKVIMMDRQGKVSDFIPANTDGDWSYLGMKVKDGKLWSCRGPLSEKHDSTGYSGLFVYDLKTGKRIKRYLTPDRGHLLNDLIFDGNDIYISDSQGGAVYKISSSNDRLEVFIPPGTFVYPNGITLTPDGGSLVLATSGGLQKIDIPTKQVTQLTHPDYYIIAIDGLYTYGDALIGFQSIMKPEAINQFTFDSAYTEVVNIKTLTCGHPAFYQPTTGAIKNGWLYFIANSYVTTLNNEKVITNPKLLKNPELYRVKLD
ncbi:hypothetical protein LVD17_21625 [Fulvivirga ulvae]|uniref:hypothetical protein n=1 Tax=Fulvivirga ulvae TaxID=2904245 RepID=UPI001F2CCECC|nr:hypothetical protein [Fulvivirga ulvae]UII30897.1 hypothetical protein LVD17_21625 [Fulvivirga ulvae]